MSIDPERRTAAPPGRRLVRDRDFLLFWAGETLSLTGTQITLLALPLTAVLVLGAGPADLGALRFLQMVPYLVLAPLVGVLIDRVRRRPVMIGANLLRLVLVAAVPVLAATGLLSLPVIMVVTLGVGVGAVLFDVSWMSFLPTLVGRRERLVEANGRLGATASAAEAGGPGLAGLLVGLLTAPVAVAVNAATFLVSVVTLLLIRVREDPPTLSTRRVRTDLVEGLRFVAGNRYLRSAALIGGLCNFFVSALQPLFVFYAVREAGVSAFALGVVLSVGAVGGVVGAASASRLIARLPVGRVYAAALTATFLGPLLVPLASGPLTEVAFTAAFLLSFLGVGVVNVLIMSLRQLITPDALMGRMNAAMRTAMFGIGSLGGPAGGLAAAAIGVRPALWCVAGTGVLFAAALTLSPVTRLRRMPEPPA